MSVVAIVDITSANVLVFVAMVTADVELTMREREREREREIERERNHIHVSRLNIEDYVYSQNSTTTKGSKFMISAPAIEKASRALGVSWM